MRAKLTKRTIDKLESGDQVFDEIVRGFGARALPSGRVSFFLKYVDRSTGKQRLTTLGQHGNITVDQARKLAEAMRGRVAEGKDPAVERKLERQKRGKARTVSQLLDDFMQKYVKERQLRSEDEYKRVFEGDVKPAIGDTALEDLKRTDIVSMLDKIAKRGAPVMADRVLAHLRAAFNWHAARDETFTPPIVKGMARLHGSARARTRVLTDVEIRSMWKATESFSSKAFGALMRFLILTAARRDEAARATWSEISTTGVWTIPEERYKTGITHTLPLSKDALALLSKLPRVGPYLFTSHGKKPFSGFSKSKAELDIKILEILRKDDPEAELEPWRIHDLRRTARSLMSRGGVSPDIAERVLGHVIGGIRGVYDRHDYLDEKKAALKSLSSEIAVIIKG